MIVNSKGLGVDTGVIASGASPPPPLSLQGVIWDLGDVRQTCHGMVPEGCQAGLVPQILDLSAEIGI